MRVAAEPLNDARPELRQLRAIMLGPFLMAGACTGCVPAWPARSAQRRRIKKNGRPAACVECST